MKSKSEITQSLDVIYHTDITVNDLRGISTPSEQVAWVSGAKGTVICTLDGGKTWDLKKVPGAEKLDFRDVKAFDKNTAYIMSVGYATESRIYKTDDGGQTWNLQLKGQNLSEFFNCMAFWNQNHGLVLSDPVDGKFTLYTTQNGCTWSKIPSDGMPIALTDEGAFAASGSCMTVYGKNNVWFGSGLKTARVFYSQDGGFNWHVSETPIKKDTKSSGVFSIIFSDQNKGMIAGGDYANPQIGGSNLAITTDGGVNWHPVDISPQYYWSSISFTPDKKNYMVVGSTHVGYTSSPFSQQNTNKNGSDVVQSTITKEPDLKEKANSILCPPWENSLTNVTLNAFSFWKKDRALAIGPKGTIVEIAIPTSKI
ncbi:WD40/YVTN/BNR-like repeat-containing protein [Legionella hackeliae]|uniref:Photosynthesis system II assembly factor Ycf48/Hcf136-like domain-containing protein n=1 Tax=Legionella hackeliae TaxID=449 RepID=A0A0A8UPA2_LEGHA|nr:hypothetical protein [Legionella hackeliae]KTD13516.1 Ycf48-like protein precursor [Legionella hackeliae]CEK09361.1 protein of unknown function [Legionella hackeliae]STX49269.1 Ycf48-like protein precursor [Legionella hackeliae]